VGWGGVVPLSVPIIFSMEGGNIMDGKVPEEIQEKLKTIEKEMGFSARMKAPQKIQIWLAIIVFAIGILNFVDHKNYFELAFFLLLGVMSIAGYFENKRLFRIHSNACDVIAYYKTRKAET
jgi:hypothetical protein